MKSATVALNVMRAAAVVQLIVGIALWTGRWTPMVDLHRTVGIVYAFALWLIAALAMTSARATSAAAFAIMWGVLIVTLGFAQQTILPGELHWITRVVHLVIGLVAIPMAEGLVKGLSAR